MKHRLVVILKSGRTVVLTSSDDRKELENAWSTVFTMLKDQSKFISLDNAGEKVIVATEELAAVMISDSNREKE
jgi:TATA-box binding protein (TBP) (component of TFIID and TFIIIB)